MKKYKAPYAGLLFTLLNSAEFNCKFVQNGKFLKPEGRDDERLNGLLLRIRESFSKTSHEAIYTRLMKLSPEEIASIKNVDDSAVQATHQSQFSAEIFSLETHSDAIVLLSEEEWNILKPVERHDGKRTRKRPQHWVPKLNEIATTNLAENGIIVNCALVWDFGSMSNTYATGLCNECGMEIQVKCRLTDEKHTLFIKVSVSGNQIVHLKTRAIKGKQRQEVADILSKKSAFATYLGEKVKNVELPGILPNLGVFQKIRSELTVKKRLGLNAFLDSEFAKETETRFVQFASTNPLRIFLFNEKCKYAVANIKKLRISIDMMSNIVEGPKGPEQKHPGVYTLIGRSDEFPFDRDPLLALFIMDSSKSIDLRYALDFWKDKILAKAKKVTHTICDQDFAEWNALCQCFNETSRRRYIIDGFTKLKWPSSKFEHVLIMLDRAHIIKNLSAHKTESWSDLFVRSLCRLVDQTNLKVVYAVFGALQMLCTLKKCCILVEENVEFLHTYIRCDLTLDDLAKFQGLIMYENTIVTIEWFNDICLNVINIQNSMLEPEDGEDILENIYWSEKFASILERYSTTILMWTSVLAHAVNPRDVKGFTTAANENMHKIIRSNWFPDSKVKSLDLESFITAFETFYNGLLIADPAHNLRENSDSSKFTPTAQSTLIEFNEQFHNGAVEIHESFAVQKHADIAETLNTQHDTCYNSNFNPEDLHQPKPRLESNYKGQNPLAKKPPKNRKGYLVRQRDYGLEYSSKFAIIAPNAIEFSENREKFKIFHLSAINSFLHLMMFTGTQISDPVRKVLEDNEVFQILIGAGDENKPLWESMGNGQKFHFYRNIAEHVKGNEIHKHHVDASMSVHEIVEKYLPANFAKFENLLEEGSTDDKMLIIKDFQIHHDEIGAMLIQSPALKIRIEKVPLKIKNGELHLAGFVARTYGKADMCHYAAVSHNANSESTPFIEFDDCRKTGKSFKNKYISISAALYVKV